MTGHCKGCFAHFYRLSHACIAMQDAYYLYQKPLPTLKISACPSLVLQLTIVVLLHLCDATEMKTLCCMCAQAHSVTFEGHGRQTIQWHSPFNSNNGASFIGMCKEDTERILGLTRYINAYKSKDAAIRQQVQPTSCLIVPFEDGVIQALCCAEDRRFVASSRIVCGVCGMYCPLCQQFDLPTCASCPINYFKHAQKCLHFLGQMQSG